MRLNEIFASGVKHPVALDDTKTPSSASPKGSAEDAAFAALGKVRFSKPTKQAFTVLSLRSQASKKRDDAALDVLRGAVMEKNAAALEGIRQWCMQIDARCEKGEPFTVLEHTAFAFLLSCDFFDAQTNAAEQPKPDDRVRSTLTRALNASWMHLTGADQPPKDPLQRLPKKVLARADRRARLYHAASFLPIGDRDAQLKESSLFRDFVPETQDLFVLGATLLAGAFSSTAGEVIASAVLSYAVIGLSESFQHNHLAHPRPGTLGGWIIRGPKKDASSIEKGVHRVVAKILRKQLEFTRVSHEVVHHGLTFKESYTKMFSSPQVKAKVDAFIDKLDEKDARQIYEELYGSTLNARGLKAIMGSIAPQVAGLLAAGIAFGASPWAFVPLILIAGVYPFTMKQVHPFLHHNKDQARESAGPIMKKILDSRWAAWACRNHWLHHEVRANYNLSFPGADALLGTLMQPNLEDLFKMADEGTLHYSPK